MAVFAYTVKDKEGKSFSGTIEAATIGQSAAILRSRGWTPTSIVAKESTRSLAYWLKRIRGIPLAEKVNFTRQLATMVGAGLPLGQALEILARQTGNERMGEIIRGAVSDIQGGASLSASLGKHTEVFGSIYVNLIKAGEASGSLDKILLRLAETGEQEREFASSIKAALIYPVIILLSIVLVFVIMVVFVIPKLSSMYKDLGVELPLPTKILIAISGFFVHFWWLIIVLGGAAFFGFFYFKSTAFGQRKITELLFRVPIFGHLKKQADLVEFTRTLSLLVGGGIPILEALEIVSESMGNILYKEALTEASRQVERGISLSAPLRANPIFPPILPQMIVVGEETGKLDEVLLKVSAFFESEAAHAVKNLSAALEPAIMVVLGIMVGLLIFSIITPIYKMTSYF